MENLSKGLETIEKIKQKSYYWKIYWLKTDGLKRRIDINKEESSKQEGTPKRYRLKHWETGGLKILKRA